MTMMTAKTSNKFFNENKLNSGLFINIFNGKVKKVALHNGAFHSDDVFAAALINMINIWAETDHAVEFIRTRNPKLIEECDLVLDVGNEFDGIKKFDHHQREGAPVRLNGQKYCSFGQIWQLLGRQAIMYNNGLMYDEEYIDLIDKTFEIIDQNLVLQIDRIDNGDRTFKNGDLMDLADVITNFNDPIDVMDPIRQDMNFQKAVQFVYTYLYQYIYKVYCDVKGYETNKQILLEAAKAGEKVAFIPKGTGPWKSVLPEIWEETKDMLGVVFERVPGEYGITMWPDVPEETFGLRCKMNPEDKEKLGMLFIHANGFFGTYNAENKEKAMEKAKEILDNVEMMQ